MASAEFWSQKKGSIVKKGHHVRYKNTITKLKANTLWYLLTLVLTAAYLEKVIKFSQPWVIAPHTELATIFFNMRFVINEQLPSLGHCNATTTWMIVKNVATSVHIRTRWYFLLLKVYSCAPIWRLLMRLQNIILISGNHPMLELTRHYCFPRLAKWMYLNCSPNKFISIF